MARPTDLVLVFCDAITRSWKQIIYFRPKEAPAPPSAERARGRGGLRRARGLPRPQRRARRAHRAGAAERAWREPRRCACARGGKLAVIGGRLEDGNLAVFAEMHRLSGGRILVFPTASGEPKAVGEESAQVFRSHGFEAEVAPLTAANAATHGARPGARRAGRARSAASTSPAATRQDRRGAGARRRRDAGCSRRSARRRRRAGCVAGSSAGAAMMSQPMILGGTSIESVVHGVTGDPEAAGADAGRGARLLPLRHASTSISSSAAGSGGWSSRWPAAGVRRGFGIDENTALLVEGGVGAGLRRVRRDGRRPRAGGGRPRRAAASATSASATSTTATGSSSGRFRPRPGAAKRPGAAARDRLPRADPLAAQRLRRLYALRPDGAAGARRRRRSTTPTAAEAFDARSGVNVTVEIERQPRRSRGLIATPESGLRMTALNFRCSLVSEQLSATRLADRIGRRGPDLRHDAEPGGADRAARLLAAQGRPGDARAGARRWSGGGRSACSPRPRPSRGATARRACRAPAAARRAGGRPRGHHRQRRLRGAGRGPAGDDRRAARHPALRRQPDPAGRDAAAPRRGERGAARDRPRARAGRDADRGERRAPRRSRG